MRIGVPIVLCGSDTSLLIVAAEVVTPERLAALRALGAPVLAITSRRAETLKARAYDGDLARLAVPDEAGPAWVRAVADPKDDLDTPMKGPMVMRFPVSCKPEAQASELSIPLQASTRPFTAATDLSNIACSSLLSLMSTMPPTRL